ncbi:sensor histidine kinase [Pimelobacter simplex]|uniref:sensor histidine kinase n=1 Tax=Nocardioides simplex TaxID=2045 RepID=UPI003AACC89F
MNALKDYFTGIPIRYPAIAVAGGVVLYLAAQQTPWAPFSVSNNAEAVEFTQGLLDLLWIGLAFAPLIALRRPWLGALVVLAPLPIGVMSEHEWPFVIYVGLAVVAVVGAWASPRQAVVVGALALAPVATMAFGWSAMVVPYGALIEVRQSGDGVGMLAAYTVVTGALLGCAMWLRGHAARDAERAELARQTREVGAERAIVVERARLARDLHDVVAHHVSLIAVRAETAPYTEPELDPAGRRVLAEVAAEARLALDELRGVLGILGRSGEAERSPQPTLADVTALVERSRRSGQEVTLRGDVQAPVGAAAGYAAYRVVQEALTNARKHAPGAPVEVVVATTSSLLEVGIANPVTEPPTGLAGGRGLPGMRERVEALGGRLRVRAAGPRFEVDATVPVNERVGGAGVS